MEEKLLNELRVQFSILRSLLLADDACMSLQLFDEFMREHEFGLALHVVCDFISERGPSQIDGKTLEALGTLHRLMEIDGDCRKPES